MNLGLFVIFAFISLLFGSFFSIVFPGGNSDLKWILGVSVFIAGEIAVFANIIIKKLDELKN